MALGVPGFVRIGAVIAGCALVAACTPEPGPTTTPTPAPSTASPTPSATPTETEIERQQRVDFEAAEKAYRANLAERQRLAALGAAKLTPRLRGTATGEYLQFELRGLKQIQEAGWRARGAVEVVGVSHGGWRAGRVGLLICEDGSGVTFIDRAGKDVTPSDRQRKFVQDFTMLEEDGLWKASQLRSTKVESFSGAPCAD